MGEGGEGIAYLKFCFLKWAHRYWPKVWHILKLYSRMQNLNAGRWYHDFSNYLWTNAWFFFCQSQNFTKFHKKMTWFKFWITQLTLLIFVKPLMAKNPGSLKKVDNNDVFKKLFLIPTENSKIRIWSIFTCSRAGWEASISTGRFDRRRWTISTCTVRDVSWKQVFKNLEVKKWLNSLKGRYAKIHEKMSMLEFQR